MNSCTIAVFGESVQHKSLPSCRAVSSCMHNIVVYLVHCAHTCMCMYSIHTRIYICVYIYNSIYIYARNARHLKFIVHVFILHAHIVYICGCAETYVQKSKMPQVSFHRSRRVLPQLPKLPKELHRLQASISCE